MRKIASKFMKFGISRKGKPMLAALQHASKNVKESQQMVLANTLKYAASTAYGRAHHFNTIHTPENYRIAVPPNTYEDLRPFIERHERGEPNVLFPGKPMFYATTSGTTAAPKRIPISQKYHDECYNGLSNLWLHSMFIETPGFMNGFDISMVGKAIEGYTEDGTSYGSFSGHMNAYMPEFIKRFRVVPFEVHDIDDYPSKYYALLRVALAYPIRWIVAANPSTLLELHQNVLGNIDDFVRDIFDGTLKTDALNIDSNIRHTIEARLTPNKKRAVALERLANKYGEQLLPKHYWPSLKIINTWKSGNASIYLQQIKNYYLDDTIIREFGYLATEARAGIVLSHKQETSILAAHLLYFEFVPRDELNNEHRQFLGAHELESDKEYGIFITTPSGLYRYDMNDIVRVEDFWGTIPMVRFVQKGSGATSLTGEKLYESQYLNAVADVQTNQNIPTGFHVAFADISRSTYQCFVEFTQPVTSSQIQSFARQTDLAIQRINPEYAAKRQSNRLKCLTVHPLAPGAFLHYKSKTMEKGIREGQFKMTHLMQDDATMELFYSLCTDQ